jgi:hypothetical protein
VLSHLNQSQPPPVVVQHKTVPAHTTTTARPAKKAHHKAKRAAQKIQLDPSLPAPLRHALLHSRVVVAVLYAPDAPGDADAVSEARKGAHAAKVGFTVLNVRKEKIARAVAQQVDGASDPAVLVVRRPGTVAVKLDGYVDADVVAQAAANTRS